MPFQSLRHLVAPPLFRRATLCVVLGVFGCGDKGEGAGSEAATETGAAVDDDPGGPGATDDGSIRGTFVFRDGQQTEIDVSARYRRFELGDVVQHSCEGSDVAAGLSLGVTWRDDTTAGTHAVSGLEGPGFIAAWSQVDGSGIRATLPSDGEITFESLGVDAGEVTEGTAHAVLHPEDDDPDDRVSEIVEIEFNCVVDDPG